MWVVLSRNISRGFETAPNNCSHDPNSLRYRLTQRELGVGVAGALHVR